MTDRTFKLWAQVEQIGEGEEAENVTAERVIGEWNNRSDAVAHLDRLAGDETRKTTLEAAIIAKLSEFHHEGGAEVINLDCLLDISHPDHPQPSLPCGQWTDLSIAEALDLLKVTK